MWSTLTDNFAAPNGADLTTSLRTDCGICQRLPDTSPFISRLDNTTHCVGKVLMCVCVCV